MQTYAVIWQLFARWSPTSWRVIYGSLGKEKKHIRLFENHIWLIAVTTQLINIWLNNQIVQPLLYTWMPHQDLLPFSVVQDRPSFVRSLQTFERFLPEFENHLGLAQGLFLVVAELLHLLIMVHILLQRNEKCDLYRQIRMHAEFVWSWGLEVLSLRVTELHNRVLAE